MPSIRSLLFTALALLTLPGWAAEAAHDHGHAPMKNRAPVAVGATFDAEGRLWRVRVEGEYLVVDHADRPGMAFSPPVRVNQIPEKIAAEGEARPDIAIGAGGKILVAWTTPLPAPYTGNIRFSRSTDGGRSFSAPVTVNDNLEEITHRFQTLFVAPDGRVILAWIDKRDGVAEKKAGRDYRGASLWYAVSKDDGASFQVNRRHALHSCECCRLALAADRDGEILVFWRHVFADGSRDHALSRLGSTANTEDMPKTTFEDWKINACPHHGPALATGQDGTRHLAWFSVVNGAGTLRHQSLSPDGTPLAAPVQAGGNQAGHPALLTIGKSVFLAWKEFDGKETRIGLSRSDDGGRHWEPLPSPAGSTGTSDNPQLLSRQGIPYLSWNTTDQGYRLLPLGLQQGATK